MRSTAEVLAHHFECFANRDLDGIAADYAADALFFTPDGVLHGPEAIRGVFENLLREFAKPGASIRSKKRLIEGSTRTASLARRRPIILTSSQTTSSLFEMEASKCRLSPRRFAGNQMWIAGCGDDQNVDLPF